MRQNQNNKRSRGRGRRGNHIGQQNFNRNTTFESNGPEGRLRGNAQQLFEKYTALAQDAQASGERVSFEAFSQFADHYYRINQTIIAASEQRRTQHEDRNRRQGDGDKPAEAGADAASETSETAETNAGEAEVSDTNSGASSADAEKNDADADTDKSDDDSSSPKEAVA